MCYGLAVYDLEYALYSEYLNSVFVYFAIAFIWACQIHKNRPNCEIHEIHKIYENHQIH